MHALSKIFFHDEAVAFAKLESLLWPENPVCPKASEDEAALAIASKSIATTKSAA